MGCWFSCLRSRPKQKTSPISSAETTPSKSGDLLFFRSHVLTLFAHEGESSPDNVRKELQNERHKFITPRLLLHIIKAKFLKACGALLKTPSEFIYPSKNPGVQSHSQDLILPPSSSLPHDPFFKELQWDEQDVPISNHHASDHVHNSNLQQNLSTCIPVGKTKSVRFEVVEEDDNKDESGPLPLSIHTPEKSTQIHLPSSMCSPGPTPLKLTKEMETPSTACPSRVDKTQIRSQFVHPISKSTIVHLVQSPESTVVNIDGMSTMGYNELKPDGEIEALVHGKSPEMGKLWDGKGIPNSTRKYNEDQKVRWHSTPFEERIEKALSKDQVHPQRKLVNGRSIGLVEDGDDKCMATSSGDGDKGKSHIEQAHSMVGF